MKTRKVNSEIASFFLVFFTLIPVLGFSQDEQNEDKTLSPYFFIPSENSGTELLPLKSTVAEVSIAGVIADVLVAQVYKNTGSKAIEAVYIFPASTRAAVYGMKMTIGERTIEAIIEERTKARQDYEDAKQQGKSASLLEQHRPNVFQMSVANILPGDEIKVELRYTELLIPEDGIYEFVYPTVVGPRYSNTPEALADVSEQWISNPYTQEGQPPLYTFDLSLSLNSGLPVSDVVCPSHNADIRFQSKDKVLVHLKDDEKFGGNRDFILRYKLKGDRITTGLLMYPGKDENFFLAMIQPPKQVKTENIPPREYVFIVDISGSMHGFPLEVSKTLFRDLIGNLRTTDKFNVILFAGGSEIFSPASVDANSVNIKKAVDFIDRQQGGGGTELLPALKRALALAGTENFSRTFVIATDGYVTVEKEAFELIRNNLGNANFFAFGIGSSVDRYLIEGMAHVGNGMPFIATSEAEAGKMAEKFRNYAGNPVLTNIEINFSGLDVYDVEPSSVPDVFSDRPVLIFGKYKGIPSGYIDLKGNTGESGFHQPIDLAQYTSSEDNSALRSLWARERIRLLHDFASRESSAELINEITWLGLNYNLLTNYTSFVAVDSEVRNSDGELISVKQPLPLPQGVSNYAVGSQQIQGIMMKNGSSSYSELIEADCVEPVYPEQSRKDKVFSVVEIMPEFIGGESALQKLIKDNLKYPKEAADKGIMGTVYVAFTINSDGTISDIKIHRGVNALLDNEALRVIRLTSSKWKPGMQRGKAVKTRIVQPIKFQL